MDVMGWGNLDTQKPRVLASRQQTKQGTEEVARCESIRASEETKTADTLILEL